MLARHRAIVCITEFIIFHSLIVSPVQSPTLASPPQVTPIPKGKMRSTQNLALSAQRDAAAGSASSPSPDWVLASPKSFGSIKDGKVIVFGP